MKVQKPFYQPHKLPPQVIQNLDDLRWKFMEPFASWFVGCD
ncbi:hypothetical protein [Halobacillus litoralis]|nr:hypothetical protein [Halobacillus litoralis]